MDDLQTKQMAGVMEGVKKELEKEKTIKCPECGFENAKSRLTCEKCNARLFPNHKSSEEKTMTKKDKKTLTKRAAGKAKEKKGAKEVKKPEEAKAKPKTEPKEKEYPVKGSVKEKLLNVIRKHKDGIAMSGIQKEMKIAYRLDSYTQELEERKLIKSKVEGGERLFFAP